MTSFNGLERGNSEEGQVSKCPRFTDTMEFWSHQRTVQDNKENRSQSCASLPVWRRPAANQLDGIIVSLRANWLCAALDINVGSSGYNEDLSSCNW